MQCSRWKLYQIIERIGIALTQIKKGVLSRYQASLQHTLVARTTAVRKIIVSQNRLLSNNFDRIIFVYDETFLICECHKQKSTCSFGEKLSFFSLE